MEILLIRALTDKQSTIGFLYLDGQPACFILEDESREVKVKKETRIPAGRYRITLRTEGTTHEKYKNHSNATIKALHRGMLWLRDVPDFEYILFHIGNKETDTDGCLLPGMSAVLSLWGAEEVNRSTEAYIATYSQVIKAMERGENVYIRVVDLDKLIAENWQQIGETGLLT